MEALLESRFGRLRGTREGDVSIFLGVPYAGPVSGEQRWRPPTQPTPWTGERDATRGGPDAYQFSDQIPLFDCEPRPTAEDALTLNVWTPELGSGGRPIMVFMHGGGYASGGGFRELYDGQFLAREADVVVVTINYRLGILGLLASPQLREPESGLSSNWCMLDQIAALEWVRDHASEIGGDPSRVTIFGESAGGVSTGLLAVSPLARGLFQKVIVQSGAPIPISLEQAHRATAALCKELGIQETDLASLRSAPVATLKAAFPSWRDLATRQGFALRPCQDGVFLPADPLELIAAGATRDLEITVGTNRDELSIMGKLDPSIRGLDEAGLLARVASLLDSEAKASEVITRFRKAHASQGMGTTPEPLYCSIWGSYFIREGSHTFLERHVASGGQGYAYLLDWESPSADVGAAHGMELPFCFGTLETAKSAEGFAGEGPAAVALRKRMLHAWADFAHGHADPAFGPPFDPERRTTMRFGPKSGPTNAPLDWERQAWRDLPTQ